MGARVLLIDDDRHFITALRAALDGQVDLRVVSAADEAVSVCADWRPHLVLLDVHIAPGDSFQVLDELSQRQPYGARSVLCLSRGAGSTTRIERYGDTVFGTLKRESDRAVLASAVFQALERADLAVA